MESLRLSAADQRPQEEANAQFTVSFRALLMAGGKTHRVP